MVAYFLHVFLNYHLILLSCDSSIFLSALLFDQSIMQASNNCSSRPQFNMVQSNSKTQTLNPSHTWPWLCFGLVVHERLMVANKELALLCGKSRDRGGKARLGPSVLYSYHRSGGVQSWFGVQYDSRPHGVSMQYTIMKHQQLWYFLLVGDANSYHLHSPCNVDLIQYN